MCTGTVVARVNCEPSSDYAVISLKKLTFPPSCSTGIIVVKSAFGRPGWNTAPHDCSTRHTPDRRQSTQTPTHSSPLCQINRAGAHGTCGDSARHDRTAQRAQHGETAQHTVALDRPPSHQTSPTTRAQRHSEMRGPYPLFPVDCQRKRRNGAQRTARPITRVWTSEPRCSRAHKARRILRPHPISLAVQVCVHNNPTASGTPEHPKAREHPRARGRGCLDAAPEVRTRVSEVWEALGKLGPSTLIANESLQAESSLPSCRGSVAKKSAIFLHPCLP